MTAADLVHATFVTVPALRVDDFGERVRVGNVAAGTTHEFGRDILELLEHFCRPQTLHSWLARPGASPRNIPTAISHAFLTDVDRLVTLAPDAIGDPVSLSGLLGGTGAFDTVVFGAPIDGASTGRGGARRGPAEIRRHATPAFPAAEADDAAPTAYLDFEMRRHYPGPGPTVADIGAVAGLAGEAMATYGPRIALISELILATGAVPAMLGGDHSCTAFALEAHLARWPALGILHFDAHHDLWPPPGPHFHYVTHANVFHDVLASPRLRAMRQFGLRVFEAVSTRRLHEDSRVSFFTARELQHLSPEAAFAGLPRDIPYYLTFDIDCIDPVFAPETGTPMPGGLTYHQALDLVDYAARKFRLVGWDIVEVGQSEGSVNGAAMCGARLVRQLLLAGMPFEPLTAYTQPSAPRSAQTFAPGPRAPSNGRATWAAPRH